MDLDELKYTKFHNSRVQTVSVGPTVEGNYNGPWFHPYKLNIDILTLQVAVLQYDYLDYQGNNRGLIRALLRNEIENVLWETNYLSSSTINVEFENEELGVTG